MEPIRNENAETETEAQPTTDAECHLEDAASFYSKLGDELDECRANITHLINDVFTYRVECAISEVTLASMYGTIEKQLHEFEQKTTDEPADEPMKNTSTEK